MGVDDSSFRFFRVRPTSDGLLVERVTSEFEQLHRAISDPFEVLLVSEGGVDEVVYVFGATSRDYPVLYRVMDTVRVYGMDGASREVVTRDRFV